MSVKSRDVDADDEEKTSCLSISLKILKEMTDVKLLCQNVGFLFITMSGFFIFAGYFIPFLFIPIRARDELGIQNYSLILSVIGIVNIPARLGFGFLADRKILSAVNLNFLCIIIATIPVWLYGLMNTFALQIVFAVFFAIGIGL
jgi:predicted MFS family arabinose efflux permease